MLKSRDVFIYFINMTIVFDQDYTSYPEFKKIRGSLCNSRPQLRQPPVWTKEPTMMLASVLGSGPRAGLCSGPSWGPHSRSGPAPPRLLTGATRRWGRDTAQLPSPATWPPRSHLSPHALRDALCWLFSPLLWTTNSLWTEPCLLVVFATSA